MQNLINLFGYLSIILTASNCLSNETLDDLNLCDSQTEITVKSVLWFSDIIALFFVTRNNTYVTKSVGFEFNVTHELFEFSVKQFNIWHKWNADVNGSEHEELNDFTHIYTIDRHLIMFITIDYDYEVGYDSEKTEIKSVKRLAKNESSYSFDILINDDNFYRTTLYFPDDKNLSKKALVYEFNDASNETNVDLYLMTYDNNIWQKSKENDLTFGFESTKKIVSAFYLTEYKQIENNTKAFNFIEISVDGSFEIGEITAFSQTATDDDSPVLYNYSSGLHSGHITQFIGCDISFTSPSIVLSTTISPNSTKSEKKSDNRIYIIAYILFLSVILFIIIFCGFLLKYAFNYQKLGDFNNTLLEFDSETEIIAYRANSKEELNQVDGDPQDRTIRSEDSQQTQRSELAVEPPKRERVAFNKEGKLKTVAKS